MPGGGGEEEETAEDVGTVDTVAGLMRMQVRVCVYVRV